MSAFYKCLVFAAGKDRKNTSVKLVNPKFGETTVWLNLRNAENKPDFGAQRVVAEILRGLVGSGAHQEITIHADELLIDDKGNYSVAMTAENLKSRWDLVANAGQSEDESAARKLFADELTYITANTVDSDQDPF